MAKTKNRRRRQTTTRKRKIRGGIRIPRIPYPQSRPTPKKKDQQSAKTHRRTPNGLPDNYKAIQSAYEANTTRNQKYVHGNTEYIFQYYSNNTLFSPDKTRQPYWKLNAENKDNWNRVSDSDIETIRQNLNARLVGLPDAKRIII
jgi:hypothetical protein